MSKLPLRRQMKRHYLIQRLNKPLGVPVTFGFGGGGYRDGGLRQEALEVLKDTFSFEYMGAAEYEWGEVPTALSFLFEQGMAGQLVSGEHRSVFYIAPRTYEQGVKNLIGQLLDDEKAARLRDRSGLADSLTKIEPRTVGWLELDNGFFFFIDKVMFERTKELFNVA
jgi:hypothetical protein